MWLVLQIAQVAAYELGIDIDLVSVRPANTFTSPNGTYHWYTQYIQALCTYLSSVSSLSQENQMEEAPQLTWTVLYASYYSSTFCVCHNLYLVGWQACVNACKALNNRINPVREHMPKSTWQEIIKACSEKMIDLSAKSWSVLVTFMIWLQVLHELQVPVVCTRVELPPNPTGQDQYEAYGVACSEVEIDVLTGEMQIERVDLLYDCGERQAIWVAGHSDYSA